MKKKNIKMKIIYVQKINTKRHVLSSRGAAQFVDIKTSFVFVFVFLFAMTVPFSFLHLVH